MKRNKIYKFIASILIVVFIAPIPYLISIERAEAQFQASNKTTANTKVTPKSAITGLSSIVSQLPLCFGKNGAITKLFKKAKVPAKGGTTGGSSGGGSATGAGSYGVLKSDENKESTSNPISLDQLSSQGFSSANSVPTFDENANKKLDEQKKKLAEIEKKTSSIEENDTCLKSIGAILVKQVAQGIATSSKNYVTTGNEGGAFFVQDTKGFFTDIAKNEIQAFNLEIGDSTLYPFSRDFAKNQVSSFKSTFASNAQYSLNQLIQTSTPEYSDSDFKGSFSKGGWNAWIAYTQVPGNNPMSFQLLAAKELQNRIDSETREANNALDRANGFLGDQRCAEPKGVTKEEDLAAKNGETGKRTCKRWEYVTPGKLIAETATNTLKYAENNLLKANDLNSAIAALLDALLNKWVGDIQINGYSEFSEEGREGEFILGDLSGFDGDTRTQTEKDFSKFQLGTNWLNENPEFNIRTDLTQAIIDEQRTYQRKLQDQNLVLRDLNKTIYQLDFCIPGPHPGFLEDSTEAISDTMEKVVSKTAEDFTNVSDDEIRGIIGGLPIVGGVISGIIDFIFGSSESNKQEKLAKYYASIVRELTAIHVTEEAKIQQKQEITNAFYYTLDRYAQLIGKYYPPEYRTNVYKEAEREFKRTVGYEEIISESEDKIIAFDGLIQRLGVLKEKIDEQNALKANGTITEEQYENNMASYITEFGRLTADMVSGEDVAQVDNILKQARDKIKYVYEDLLTGEYGCEKDLDLGRNLVDAKFPDGTIGRVHPAYVNVAGYKGQDKSWLFDMRRREYPHVVWYDYNLLKNNEAIPVPEGIKQYLTPGKLPKNKMPAGYVKDNEKGGPGFLSAVAFDTSASHCGSKPLPEWQLDCLQIHDLFLKIDNWGISVGKVLPNYPDTTDPGSQQDGIHGEHSFEDLIEIY